MLHELTIQSLGVIDDARIEFAPGFTVVTGETGAGKTMVLTGIGLILGAKSVRAVVRAGDTEALAQAVIDVPAGSPAHAALVEAGIAMEDDGTVVVARTLSTETRSRSLAGGRTVPQALLAEVADTMVTVHGQSDQTRLRSAAAQRDTLDGYAGPDHQHLLSGYVQAWEVHQAAAAALLELSAGRDDRQARLQILRDDLAAIDAVDPEPGEDAALKEAIDTAEHAESVRGGMAAAHHILAGEHDATLAALSDQALRALDQAAQHDPSLADLHQRLGDVGYLVADLSTDLAGRIDAWDADPRSLDQLQQRRSELLALERRLGADLDGVIAHAEQARREIQEEDSWEERVAAATERVEATAHTLHSAGAALSASRREHGDRLAAEVQRELAELAMPDAHFTIEVAPAELGPRGADAVRMVLAAHPGAPARPVAEAASGGELSRIMLAIEVSLAHGAAHQSHTFVFDEVDAGVGGKAALAVGSRLAQLAQAHQVIVVTHLAQVAAFADRHVVVQKSSDGHTTQANVGVVEGAERVREVARLLSGHEDSQAAHAHAEELLAGARTGLPTGPL